jgi:hypothetical protein
VVCGGGVQQVIVDTTPPRLRHGWTAPVGADGPVTVGAGLVWSVDRSAGTLDGLDPATGHVVVSHPVALDSSQHFPIVAVTSGHALVEAGRRVVAFTVPGRSTTTSS